MSKILGKFITIDDVTITLDGNSALKANLTGAEHKIVLQPSSFNTPISGYAVNEFASMHTVDGLPVRLFSSTIEQGVGFGPFTTPTTKTSLSLTFHWSATDDPGASKGVVWRLYHRMKNADAILGSWSSGLDLSAQYTTNLNQKIFSQTVTFASLGSTPGDTVQFELTRSVLSVEDDLEGFAQLSLLQLGGV